MPLIFTIVSMTNEHEPNEKRNQRKITLVDEHLSIKLSMASNEDQVDFVVIS